MTGHGIFYGAVVNDDHGYLVVVYSFSWAPDEPICEWMVPGTYIDREQFNAEHQ